MTYNLSHLYPAGVARSKTWSQQRVFHRELLPPGREECLRHHLPVAHGYQDRCLRRRRHNHQVCFGAAALPIYVSLLLPFAVAAAIRTSCDGCCRLLLSFRSDVLGQLMPIVGRDWSHTGVAELFTKIKRSGYLILYLTARAIGQADATRDYLFGLTQKERDKLPGANARGCRLLCRVY